MPVIQQYYLDAPSLGSATSVFIDSALTVCAPDGYYSDGVITREQVGCVLLPEQPCPDCGLPCDSTLLANENYQGVFRIDSNAGTGTGAIKVWLDPQNIPEGIRVIFNSQAYNKLSSPFDGLHQTTNPIGYTYIGNTANDCGISGTTYPVLTNYVFDGTNFVNQGTTQTITVAAGDVSLSAGNPGKCLMVIPKPSAAAAIISTYIVGPCATSVFELEVECPETLPLFSSTETLGSSEAACETERTQIYYFASVYNSPTIQINDYVFYESYGQTPLPDGFYGIDNAGVFSWIQVQNGIVIDIGVCSDCIDWRLCNTSDEPGAGPCAGPTGRAIRFTWYDCLTLELKTQIVDPGDCICIQTTLADIGTYFGATWDNYCIPDPAGPDYTLTPFACI